MTAAAAPPADDEPDAPGFQNVIKAAPRVGNVYWCRFPQDARKPEFWKTRPVVVVSHKNTLLGPVLVVPLSTKPQPANPWAHQFPRNPVPKEIRPSSAICNHLYTVSCSRLIPHCGQVPKVDHADLQAIRVLARTWLASPAP